MVSDYLYCYDELDHCGDTSCYKKRLRKKPMETHIVIKCNELENYIYNIIKNGNAQIISTVLADIINKSYDGADLMKLLSGIPKEPIIPIGSRVLIDCDYIFGATAIVKDNNTENFSSNSTKELYAVDGDSRILARVISFNRFKNYYSYEIELIGCSYSGKNNQKFRGWAMEKNLKLYDVDLLE